MFGLALLFVYVFLLSFYHFDHLAWGRGSWSLSLSCICLLAMHMLIYHFFSSSWYRGGWLRAASACGSSWTFLLTFFIASRTLLVTNGHRFEVLEYLGIRDVTFHP